MIITLVSNNYLDENQLQLFIVMNDYSYDEILHFDENGACSEKN